MANPKRGETNIRIGRKSYTVAYDWQSIGSLKEEIGTDWDDKIGQAGVDLDLDTLAKALEIGLRKHHGDALKAEDIAAASPPVVQVNTVIQTALTRAFHGTDEPPEGGGGENPRNGPLTWLRRLFALPWKRA